MSDTTKLFIVRLLMAGLFGVSVGWWAETGEPLQAAGAAGLGMLFVLVALGRIERR